MDKIEYKNCFICGSENSIGLKLEFFYKDKKVYAEWISKKDYQGFDGVVHGGIIASLIDEAVAQIIMHEGYIAVTTELNVKYLKPFPIGKKVVICAEIVEHRRKIIIGKAVIYDKESPSFIYARGDANYYIVKNFNDNIIS